MPLTLPWITFDPNDPHENWVRICLAIVFGLLICAMLSACAIPRPDTTLYVVNSEYHQAKGYNLKTDYDSNMNRLSTAKPKIIPVIEVQDLNKFVCTNPDGFANLKAYVEKLRQAYSECKAGN